MILGKYQIAPDEEIEYKSCSKTCIVVNKNEQLYFAKWLNGIEKKSAESKILLEQLRQQKKIIHPIVPQIIEYDWDDSQAAYCIIFEYIEARSLEKKIKFITPSSFMKGIEQIVSCLQDLHQKHQIVHGAISSSNILIGNSFDFYLVDFELKSAKKSALANFTAPEKLDPTLKNKSLPYQADIYSIGKVIEWYFKEKKIDDEEEIDELINKACAPIPANRFNYISLHEELVTIVKETIFDTQNTVWVKEATPQILRELNKRDFNSRFRVAPHDPNKGENILLDIATQSFNIHCLWLVQKKELLIRSFQKKEEDKQKYRQLLNYGEDFDFPVVFRKSCYPQFDLSPIFRDIQKNNKKERNYRAEKRHIFTELSFFKDLLIKEKEVLEQNSLRLKYIDFEKKGDFEIHLKLENNDEYSSDGFIRAHIDRATPPNPEEFEFMLSTSNNKKQTKDSFSFTGIAYAFNSKTRVLKFKDCDGLNFSKITKSGYLLENIRRQEEEKNRQLEAIRKVENNEVENRDLIHSLFNPKDLEAKNLGNYDLDQVFQKDENGTSFIYSQNQKKAILNALYKKPLTVIQGPPGTGKTTVITEIVFQILDKNPDAKILITSQTNNAVDNVLENLLKMEIPIVRLSGVRQPNPVLRKHTLERKIEGWKEKVQEKARENWVIYKNHFKENLSTGNTEWSSIFDILSSDKNWTVQAKHLSKTIAQFDALSSLSASLNTKAEFLQALTQITSIDFKDYFTKQQLHSDWLTAIGSLNENSKLNKKLIDSIQVIGATTNHIASGKYKKYSFEFDYVIMDESGKATLSESLIPLVMAKNAVLVGDHRQLRPMLTANREVENWLRNKYKEEAEGLEWDDYFNRPSLFEQVIEQIDADFKSQLEECRRSSKDQVSLTSQCFYEPFGDQPIRPVERPQEKEHNLDLKVDSSIVFFDIGNDYKSDRVNGSSRNKKSAELIPELLKNLDRYEQLKNYSIGVITGYSAQLSAIKSTVRQNLDYRELKHIKRDQVTISVVDRFQGLEKDIIIFDLVKSQDGLGFLANANRINVALSRQKKLLIIIGNLASILDAQAPKCYQKWGRTPALQKYLQKLEPKWIINSLDQLF